MINIIVRKNPVQRYFFRIFLLLISVVLCLIFWHHEYPLLLIFLPFEAIFLVILIYMESWKIVFLADGMEKKVFFLSLGYYSYSAINDAYLSYSATDHEYVALHFSNQKRITFRMKDVNASRALKVIRSHKSISLKKP